MGAGTIFAVGKNTGADGFVRLNCAVNHRNRDRIRVSAIQHIERVPKDFTGHVASHLEEALRRKHQGHVGRGRIADRHRYPPAIVNKAEHL